MSISALRVREIPTASAPALVDASNGTLVVGGLAGSSIKVMQHPQ
jgi:hypothetical protein